MRVRRAAIGSVMLIYWCSSGSSRLPAGLAEAGNIAAHGCFAQLGATQTGLTVVAVRSPRERPVIAQRNRWRLLLESRGSACSAATAASRSAGVLVGLRMVSFSF